ncbi:MAG: peptidylprolyl isomerase [Planctomycetes bacterium]|nr:peptidylprolyl isomerase [Planctomycetota bacterium]
MLKHTGRALMGSILLYCVGIAAGQTQQVPAPKVEPPPARDVVAARVNGQAIPELAVYRGLMRVAPQRREEARKDVLSFLIDNTIVDQYLLQLKIPVDAKEIDEHVEKIKKEAAEEKKNLKDVLAELMITEDELRNELASSLRWDKFVIQQGTDKVLHDFFKGNIEMFNGSKVHARHILITVVDGKKEAAQIKLAVLKKEIEDEATQAVAKLPAASDAITREKERARVLEKAFAERALKHSSCPSSKEGGDLGMFPRAGAMVEPFARAAFALKPYQISDPVATEFGYHLILAVDYKAGKDVKFEDKPVRAFVQEVYGERLREAVLAAYKTKSKIDIFERAKK